MKPQLWVFAGPNGAGKSTIADRYAAGRLPVVNPDTIARTLPESLGETARLLLAGRLALQERADLLMAGLTFAIETTLTGRSEITLMRGAATTGYKINLVYVGLPDVQNSIARVRQRVFRGGHDVPLTDLLRRFDRSIANLRTASAIADRVLLIDNGGKHPRLVFSRHDGRVRYAAPNIPGRAETLVS